MRLVAVDVDYDEAADSALAAAVVFDGWVAEAPLHQATREHRGLAAYEPGAFYRRELPCVVPLLESLRAEWKPQAVIVDGFVDLGEGRAGLGRHLFDALGGTMEVIGVAKTPFTGRPGVPVVRGEATKPLWVTSTGDAHEAARGVASMHGPYRVPSLLRLVDQLARKRG